MRKTIVTSEVIVLGRQGEDGANKVLFPVRGWKELYGDGQFVVTVQRPDENDPYPVSSTLVGMFVEWIVGSADVEIPGRGKVELAYYTSDDVRVKSVVYHTVIYDALGQNSLTPPEPWQNWVDQVREAGADAIQAAEDAAASAEGAAQAADDAEQYADDARQSAENAAGAVSDAFSQITATATTLSPGSSATASFDPSTKVMSFGIPKGDPGSGGGGGDDIFVAIKDTTTFSEVYAAYIAGKTIFAKDATYNRIYVLVEYVHNNYVNRFTFTGAKGSWDWGPAIGELILEEGDGWTMGGDTLLEKRGVISVGNYEYEVQRKALAITENGVTTTYYVADITTSVVH